MVICMHFFSSTLIKYLLHRGRLDSFQVLLLVLIIYVHTRGFTAARSDSYSCFTLILLTGSAIGAVSLAVTASLLKD